MPRPPRPPALDWRPHPPPPMRLLAVLLVAAAPMAPALAQPVAPCTYADCAIRIEPALFSRGDIVQGRPGAGVRVGRLGLFGGGLEDVVADVPAALEHARAARRSTVGAAVTSVAATVAYLVATDALYDEPSGADVALLAGGIGLSVAGVVFGLQAQRRQSRAVWEYNRAVAGD